jgi:heptosyltransferase-2/heptosyltransferase-3
LLFLTPALRRLRTGLPDAEIVGLVGPWGVPVLERNPNLDRLIVWDFPWFDRRPRRSLLGPYASLARLATLLRAERIDLALQFRADFWWGALAVRLAKIPEHVGFDAPVVRDFLTDALPLRHGAHAARENLRLAESIVGAGNGDEPLEFPIYDSDRARADELLSTRQSSKPLVALQVGAGAPVKVWPLDRLAAVGRAMRDELGAGIVVVGGPGEVAQVQEVVGAVGDRTIGLAGKTTVGELAAVLERCDLALGPDSGPLHLAVAVGTPTVHLFGPADPARFGPYGEPSWHVVVQSDWPCAPCHRLDFPPSALARHPCVSTIGVGEVTRVARDVLERSMRRPVTVSAS